VTAGTSSALCARRSKKGALTRPALRVLDLLAERRRPDPCLGAAPREV